MLKRWNKATSNCFKCIFKNRLLQRKKYLASFGWVAAAFSTRILAPNKGKTLRQLKLCCNARANDPKKLRHIYLLAQCDQKYFWLPVNNFSGPINVGYRLDWWRYSLAIITSEAFEFKKINWPHVSFLLIPKQRHQNYSQRLLAKLQLITSLWKL